MKFKKRNLALVLALSLGLASAFVTYSYLKNLSAQTAPVVIAPRLKKVVIAQGEIPSKTTVTGEMVTYAELPADAVLPGSATDLEDVVGAITKNPIMAGEIINRSRLWDKGVTPGLTFQIPMGKRAITVGINEVIGVAGFVKPGDYVDVLATMEDPTGGDITSTILQHVQVLAIAQQTEDKELGEPKVTTSLTLAVSLDEAERLTLAEERGILRIVLRPAEQHDLYRVSPVTTNKLLAGDAPAAVRQAAPVKGTVSIKRIAPAPPKRVPVEVEVIKGTQRQTVEVMK